MKNLMITLFLSIFVAASAETISSLAVVSNTAETTNKNERLDDYIRLKLIEPNYKIANQIRVVIEESLGPNMVRVESDSLVLVQAPRDSTQRVEFISWVLGLEVTIK